MFSTLMMLVSSLACASLHLICVDVLYCTLLKFITIAKAHDTLFMLTFMTTIFL
jgi:hypothetical protein